MNQKRTFWSGILFLVLATTWLYAPAFNAVLKLGPNLISEYEAIGQTHSLLFRAADLLAAALLGFGIWTYKSVLIQKYSKQFWYGLVWVSIFLGIDSLSSLTCQVTDSVCAPIRNPSFYVHATESVLLTSLLIVLTFSAARKYSKWWWFFWAQIVTAIIGITANFTIHKSLYFVQIANQLIILIWLQQIVFASQFDKKQVSAQQSRNTRRFLAAWVLVNAVASLSLAWLHVTFSEKFDDALFGGDTAWFGQHSLIVGISFLVLARFILQGHRRAWQILAGLLFVEVLKYSSIESIASIATFFMLQFAFISMSSFAFVRHPSDSRLSKRLRIAVVPVVASILLVSLSIAFRAANIRAWEHSLFTPARVVSRFLLLEINVSPGDPLPARLFAQLITVLGICFYVWLISSLFLPETKKTNSDFTEAEEIISTKSMSSEDVFKLWPKDKQYWEYQGTVVAYKVVNSTAFALADPVGKAPQATIVSFIEFARTNGWQTSWIMIGQQHLDWYKNAGLQTLSIGSSAVVDIKTFSEVTIRDKWWRWVRNKNSKVGLVYVQLGAPQSSETLTTLREISDEWLNIDGRAERSFALGYFDESFLKGCTIHALKNSDGKLVAFTNQLPTYAKVTTASIDLMRSMREYEGSMAFLLSETIASLSNSNTYIKFDLGFVPFAAEKESRAQRVLRVTLKPVFSAHGLKQFKNKFDPEWQPNYLAWDGDVLDLLNAAKNLSTALKVEDKQ